MNNECCAKCRYYHRLKHNFKVSEGFEESYCCDALMHPSEKNTRAWVQEVTPEDRCEMFEEKDHIADADKMIESTPKNNLGVELISREDVLQILLDYDNANENALVLKDIKALPSVTPQEPSYNSVNSLVESKLKNPKAKTFDVLHFVADNAGLSTFEAIEKAYNMGVSEQEPVLDKIRAEIEHMIPCSKEALSTKLGVLEIIDKYKAEVGPQESEDKKEETEYQRQVEQYQYDTLYEPTFDLETGSM